MIALMLAVALSQAPAAPRRYPAGDGCNTCTDLGGGFASCTLMACSRPGLKFIQSTPDLPLANPDAKGTATVLFPGADYVNLSGHKVVVLDEQEDVSRERDRVEGRAGEAFWRKVAIGSITGGAILAVTAGVIGGLAAAHKL